MISICSQPDEPYFHWQNLIQFYNLEQINSLENHRAIFLYRDGKEPSEFVKKFKKKFPENVFIFEDNRNEKFYIPTLKIHGVVKYLEQDTRQQDLFLIDSDVIFREPIDFRQFEKENTVYCSNTKGYLGYQYLKTKGDDIVKDMCEFIGVSFEDVVKKNDKSGGAQLYYKGIPHNVLLDYFREVETQSPKLYNLMRQHKTYNDHKPPIQAWTSEMWCVLWLLWKRDIETEIVKELDFRWATDNLDLWETTKMLHMAGVTREHKDKFFKGDFINKNPFNHNYDYIDEKSITIKYIEEMKNTKESKKYQEFISYL